MIREITVKTALSKSNLKELDYALNPYLGCRLSCTYCYARYFSPEEVKEKWGEVILVKSNLLEVLRREVNVKRRGVVGVSTVTDPYQPVEAQRKITRGSLEILLKSGFRVSIQTKSPLVLRDVDVLSKYREKVDVGITITTVDRDVSKEIEPFAPLPDARFNAVKGLRDAGIETWIFLGPIIPGVNEHFEGILERVKDMGIRVIYDFYNHYPGLPFSRIRREKIKELEEKLKRLCLELGIQCHSEEEDWIFEKRRANRPLF
ncbi:radical SAM protein [Sulfolobales archaeon HS-7]|nr:radical SAM protein [Sulfolobales archaeon HS-7]